MGLSQGKKLVLFCTLYFNFFLIRTVVARRIPQIEESSNLAPVRFLSVGDWGRKGKYNQSLIAEQMGYIGEKLDVQFVISNGDNFYSEGLNSVIDPAFTRSFTSVYTASSLQVQWYAVLGNHDYYGNTLAQLDPSLTEKDSRWFCKRSMKFSMPLCSPWQIVSNCSESIDFIFFDTTPLVTSYRNTTSHTMDWRGLNVLDWETQNTLQLQELEDFLANSTARWKIVIGHHPVYSYGKHGDTYELITWVKPILEKYGVDAYMSGHDHDIQHIKRNDSSVHYFVNGGGSKAYQNITVPNLSEDLKYFWIGQGFAGVQVDVDYFKFDFYGPLGETLYSKTLTK